MLQEGSVVVDRSGATGGHRDDWKLVHQRLRGIRRKRSALDAEEARLLVEAERMRLWRQFGCATLLDYLERVLDHSPREAIERMRIARALTHLPALSAALAEGDLHYSVIRELTRKVTPATEDEWLAAVRGKTTREVDELLAGRKPGDRPCDPAGPDLRPRTIPFDLSPETRALLRQVRSQLADELGRSLDDDQLIATLCRRAMELATTSERPAYQVAVTVCEQCRRGWQNGAGREIEIGPAVIERAQCDADHLGHLDAAVPARVTPTISPRKRRQVFARDHHRCTRAGCRSARNLEVHHIVWKSRGGTHALRNLTLLCSACHEGIHAGLLSMTGSSPDKLEVRFRRPIHSALEPDLDAGLEGEAKPVTGRAIEPEAALGEARVVEAKRAASLVDDARAGLVGLGFKPGEARAAVELAVTHAGRGITLEGLLVDALRWCPRPVTR